MGLAVSTLGGYLFDAPLAGPRIVTNFGYLYLSPPRAALYARHLRF